MRIIVQDGNPLPSNSIPQPRSTSSNQGARTPNSNIITQQTHPLSNFQTRNTPLQSPPHRNSQEERSNKKHKSKDEEGYNSGDEHIQKRSLDVKTEEEKLKIFLREKKYELHPTLPDGNCLFRAIADQVYGDQEMHGEVRKRCMDYLEKERDHFSQFVTEDFSEYLRRKRQDGCFGNNLEIQVISEMYNRRVEVFADGELEPLNIFQGAYETGDPPIRLSYHHGNHYNSLFDPELPAAGVGLGLPGLEPGLADRMQMREAKQLSELSEVEESVLEEVRKESDRQLTEKQLELSVLGTTTDDWIQTQQELEDQVLEASLLEYWKSTSRKAGGSNT